MRYTIESELPRDVTPPLRFREPNAAFEGEVDHPRDIVRMFEPVDVLNGATELVDANGKVLIITADSGDVAATNEYPMGLKGLYFELRD